MLQTWRWFGPNDPIPLDDILQAGVEGIVTALHDIPNGEVWPKEKILDRIEIVKCQSNGAPTNFNWEVVESLAVSEEIKKQDGDWKQHIENYKSSIGNLAEAGISTICYNFMPILDWTRTDLAYELPNGAICMRFDLIDFALFEIHILKRPSASKDYDAPIIEKAAKRFEQYDDAQLKFLADNIVTGFPGANQKLDMAMVRELLAQYNKIDAKKLKKHLLDFLGEVVPIAEKHGVRLCCHPDDPPFPLLGLPRIMSTEDNYRELTTSIDSPANGITLCSGSLGARADNDLPGMMERLGDKVHFLHLRNVQLEAREHPSSFYEAEHLDGSTDMVALIKAILLEEKRRKETGRSDYKIPMRPDHGQNILDDLNKKTQPGYPAIGRLKGLAELRGVERALTHTL